MYPSTTNDDTHHNQNPSHDINVVRAYIKATKTEKFTVTINRHTVKITIAHHRDPEKEIKIRLTVYIFMEPPIKTIKTRHKLRLPATIRIEIPELLALIT